VRRAGETHDGVDLARYMQRPSHDTTATCTPRLEIRARPARRVGIIFDRCHAALRTTISAEWAE